MTPPPPLDVLTFGEALLRLTPPNLNLMEQSPLFERHIAGSELNTAVGLSRLGLRVGWVSRMPNNPPARLVVDELGRQGVLTDDVIWTDEGRLGIFYMEEARPPRASQVTYDRAHSAISQMQPTDLPADLIQRRNPRLVHLTGITPALSQAAHDTTFALMQQAQAAHVSVSFDVNYRAKLWDTNQAALVCERFLQAAQVIFIAQRDAERFYGTGDLHRLHAQFPQAIIAMSRGADGASAIDPAGKAYHQPIYPAEVVCRIGGGDAFAAGFLAAYLDEQPLPACLRYGAAAAALKYSLNGDLPLFDRQQVEAVIAAGGAADVNR